MMAILVIINNKIRFIDLPVTLTALKIEATC